MHPACYHAVTIGGQGPSAGHREETWRRYAAAVSSATAYERLLQFEAVHNFRDLGGYATSDGRTTRWRTLYRADGLQRLTPGDVELLRPLGLKTVLDLRTEKELTERGRFPVDAHPVDFHHLPVIDVTWERRPGDDTADPVPFLFGQYLAILRSGESLLAQAFRILAGPGALPAVFHCAAGKDRTGVLAALVLGALGVAHDVIAEDYGLSRGALDRTKAWMAERRPDLVGSWDNIPAAHLAATPEAMERLLDHLAAQHGSVRGYLRSIGVSDAVLDRLAAGLLVDPG